MTLVTDIESQITLEPAPYTGDYFNPVTSHRAWYRKGDPLHHGYQPIKGAEEPDIVGAAPDTAPPGEKPLDDMTVKELRTVAATRGVEVPKKINRDALIALLAAPPAAAPDTAPPGE